MDARKLLSEQELWVPDVTSSFRIEWYKKRGPFRWNFKNIYGRFNKKIEALSNQLDQIQQKIEVGSEDDLLRG